MLASPEYQQLVRKRAAGGGNDSDSDDETIRTVSAMTSGDIYKRRMLEGKK